MISERASGTASSLQKGNSNTMVMLAKAMTEQEMTQAAEYFAAVKWRPHVTVVETDRVPVTQIQGELFIPKVNHVSEHKLTEPIGNRIIEVPTDVDANQILRSSRGTWVADVPPGAIARGKNLVTTGGSSIVNNQDCPRESHGLRHVPRAGPEGHGAGHSAACRQVSKLPRARDLRHPAGDPCLACTR